MRRRHRLVGSVAAVVGVAALTACAGAAAVDSWLQGTWTCTSIVPYGSPVLATVEVHDGTWSASIDGSRFDPDDPVTGAWSLSGGTLSVTPTEESEDLTGTIVGVPKNTDGLGTLAGVQWGEREGTTSVSATIDSVSITRTDESEVTTTSCTKG